MITRKVYHLPRIQDILRKRNRYLFFTKLDISMQYYTFELDEASKELCTICTPFGNYRYNRLPMGIKQSPDIAQQVMENLLRAHTETDVYIDDIGIFSQQSWEEHLTSLYNVLQVLQDNNFTVNPLKCEWAVKETDWLGYWLTPEGVKPWRKKIDPILAIQPPTSISELRSFVGSVNFYRDMFRKRSHMLAPLTAQSGQRKINWTPECQAAFEQVKATLAREAFLQYPDHNKPFHIYADASDYQMGSVILQEGKPVAFFSRKLNSAQRNYTTGEKEILSIVETLKEYRTMLFGCRELHVYTDHRNLTFTTFQTQRVLRWRLFLEEYGPIFHFIEGKKNLAADALSRLPFPRGRFQTRFFRISPPMLRDTNPLEPLASIPFFQLSQMIQHCWIASFIYPTNMRSRFKWIIKLLPKPKYRTLYCSSKHKQSRIRYNVDSLHPGSTFSATSRHPAAHGRSSFLALCFVTWCDGITLL
jgi:hypothetical protein